MYSRALFWDQVKELKKQVYALGGSLLRHFRAVCILIPTLHPKLFSSKITIVSKLSHGSRCYFWVCTLDIACSSNFKWCFLLLKIIFQLNSWMHNLELFQVSRLLSRKFTRAIFSDPLFSPALQTSAACSVLCPWNICLSSSWAMVWRCCQGHHSRPS